jgi:hypothetical protein
MKIKELFFKFLNWYITKTPLLSNVTVTAQNIEILVATNTKAKFIFVSDNQLTTISEERLKQLLKVNFTKFIQYHAEFFDCDDYTAILNGEMKLICPNIAFGIAWTETHAFNVAILDNKEVVFIEPQTNRIIHSYDYKFSSVYYPVKVVIL